MSARVAVGVLLLVGVVAALVTLDAGSGRGGPPASPSDTPAALATSDSCRECHPSVYDEWRASMHSRAFVDPQVRAPDQSDDFRKAECLPCHAPAPVFRHGIVPGTRVLARTERRVDGVDCLACHGLEQGVAASRTGLSGACRPTYRPELSRDQLCFPCHNQHQTHDEWRASPAAAAGKTCIDCHMPRVTRTPPEAGAPRAGRHHGNWGGRDEAFALAGIEMSHEVDERARTLSVTITNAFAAHNLPTDSRNRALDLVVTLYDAGGLPIPPPAGATRGPGQHRGTARMRLRNPYRSSGDPNTQIPAGESRTLTVALPDDARRAAYELVYKLSPWVPDEQAHWTELWELELPAP